MGLIEAVGGREWIERHVDEALSEDLGRIGDITCQATVADGTTGRAELVAKADGILAGRDWAIICGERTTPPVVWTFNFNDGSNIRTGETVAEVTGPLNGILACERTALNGLARLSGIATMASVAVQLVEGTRAKVIDTRKTTPGWRLAEKYAVRAGGASNHRIGLYDEILIKENHIRSAGGLTKAVESSRRWRDSQSNEDSQVVPIEVEVTNLDELLQAAESGADRILLDNFTLDQIKEAVRIVSRKAVLEASGGITLDNLESVAQTGVDRISLGALTHTIKPLDFSLQVR